MRRLILSVMLAAILAAASWTARAGEGVAAADRAAIQAVIAAQIEAFRRGDGDTALSFAVPALQKKFGDGETFLALVRHAYAPVLRPRSYSFGAVEIEDGRVTQKVELVGEDDAGSLAVYDMEREPDGTWRIAGCSLLDSERLRT